jgi:diaminohydroxyphosphoribosylaminopyrimidine deaminase / 5-amino-6-(5-phosphoribosylamino)uracil reductase
VNRRNQTATSPDGRRDDRYLPRSDIRERRLFVDSRSCRLLLAAPGSINAEDELGEDEVFMTRALELAVTIERTAPNPKVGAVVVKDGTVISEGHHRGPGTPHAEAVALDGINAAGSTLYVNLEPCNHTGAMPPCVPAIAAAGVDRVVAAVSDPDPRVKGAGVSALRDRGIEVTLGVLEDEATRLNAGYLHHRLTGRPRVTLKLAFSLDGAMAAPDGSARWISSEATRERVHMARHKSDAVLIGAGSVVADDPQLTVRAVQATRQPTRVIVDSAGRVPAAAAVFAGDGDVIIATTDQAPATTKASWKRSGAEVMTLARGPGGVDIQSLLMALGQRGCLDLYCEGGAELATTLLREGLVDQLEIHYGPKLIGRDGVRIGDLGVQSMGDARAWRTISVEQVGGDVIVTLERGEG